jgi:diaminopimelate decarboxylase
VTTPAATGPDAIEVGRTVAGLDPVRLVAEHGSPLYVYDAAVMRTRITALRTALPAGVDLAYATKANGSPLVLASLAGTGLGADVASGGELRAAMRAGFEAAGIVFTGPGKTDLEIREALAAGVGLLTLESLDELESVLGMAALAGSGQGLALRLETVGEGEGRSIIGAPGNVKFGLTDEEANEAVVRLRAAGVLAPRGPFVLRGFHAFGASNVLDAGFLVAAVTELAQRAETIARRHDLTLEVLDAGGGLGIPYAAHESALDLAALGEGMAAELATWAHRPALRSARLLLEPGRWLTGPAGTYLCSVTRTKDRGGRVIAIADGGIHHLIRPRLVGQDHRVVPVGDTGAGEDVLVDLVGPLCTGLDVLASAVPSPRPRAGDLYAVLDAGAYGYSESMPLFLSHPIPAEVVIDAGVAVVSRERKLPD